MEKKFEHLIKGMVKDVTPDSQPNGSYRFALNTIIENENINAISNEKGNIFSRNFGQNYIFNGSIYIDNNEHVIFLVKEDNSASKIVIYNTKFNTFSVYIDDTSNYLTLRLNNRISGVYRLKNGCEKVIYFVDGYNKARTLNLSNNYSLPNDLVNINLINESLKIPIFSKIEVISGGNTLSGTYNFAIQYVDDSDNTTQWLIVSPTIPIYVAQADILEYDSVLGSSNQVLTPTSVEERVFGDPPASKSIKIGIDNFDKNFKGYRVAIIMATSGTGFVNKVLVSPTIPFSSPEFVFSGENTSYTEISVEEIISSQIDIGVVKHIMQVENRLLISNVKSSFSNLTSLQKYASRIKSEFYVKEFNLYDSSSDGNPKNPETYIDSVGYMPGEVYAFGIIYIFENGTESTVNHIPGRPRNSDISDADTWTISEQSYDTQPFRPDVPIGDTLNPVIPFWKVHDTTRYNKQGYNKALWYYEVDNATYNNSDFPNENDFWGKDFLNNTLDGSKIRHHRFPTRGSIPAINNSAFTDIRINMHFTAGDSDFIAGEDISSIKVEYEDENNIQQSEIIDIKVPGIGTTKNFTLNKAYIKVRNFKINENESQITKDCSVSSPPNWIFDTVSINGKVYYANNIQCNQFYDNSSALITVENTSDSADKTGNLLGIKFSGIELPPGVIGYRIVRAKREEGNKLVLDRGLMGTLRHSDEYLTFNGFTENVEPISFEGGADDYVVSIHPKNEYLFSPKLVFEKRKIIPTYVKRDGYFLRNWVEPATTSQQNVNDESTGWFDNDGFDWIGTYVRKTFEYHKTLDNNRMIENLTYIPMQSSSSEFDGLKAYNISVDNYVGFAKLPKNTASDSYNTVRDKAPSSVALCTIRDVYSNLENLIYIPVTANAKYYDNPSGTYEITVFGGDTFLSHMYLTSSMPQLYMSPFRLIDFIVKLSIIIAATAAAIISTIITVGTDSPLAVAALIVIIAAIGISATASIIILAIDSFYNELDSNPNFKYMIIDKIVNREGLSDDTILSLLEYSKGFWIDNEINISLRERMNQGFSGVLTTNGYKAVSSYITDKFLIYDKETTKYHYTSVSKPEVYKYNPDFSRKNEEKIYFPINHTFSINCFDDFPNRIYYSDKASQEEFIDSYRKFKPLNYIEVPGEYGEITNMLTISGALFVNTNSNIWYIPKSIQERVTNDIVSLVGTGGFFASAPVKIKDSIIGSAGTDEKFSFCQTPYGIFYFSNSDKSPYLMNFSSKSGTQLKRLNNGMVDWFYNNGTVFLKEQLNNKNISTDNIGVGYISAFDYKNNRIILTKIDYKILNSYYSIFDYIDKELEDNTMYNNLQFSGDAFVYNYFDNKFWFLKYVSGDQHVAYLVNIGDQTYFENKSFTISYSFYVNAWVSFHSYLPIGYVYDADNLLSVKGFNFYKHNLGNYQEFYGDKYPHIIDYVSVKNPLITSVYDYIEFITTAIEDGIKKDITFNKLIAYNSTQSTGLQNITAPKIDENYMMASIKRVVNTVSIKKFNRNWKINNLRDYISNNDEQMFLTDWNSIRNQYFIDKVVNDSVIDYDKDWNKLSALIDKYLRIRLIFEQNNNNVKLITNFTLENFNPIKE